MKSNLGLQTVCDIILSFISRWREFELGICLFSQHACEKNWDCQTCQGDLTKVADGATCHENVGYLVENLQGPILCENPNFVGNTEQSAICQEFVAEFLPEALIALTVDMMEKSETICAEVFSVC